MTESQLAQAETAIEKLSDALQVSEQEIVLILRKGMESLAPIANQLSKSNEYFINEMESTFGIY